MKKKSKILNKLITALLVVLCVALLCVPAFASSDNLVEVFPEETLSINNSLGSIYDGLIPLVEGYKYRVIWNGVSYDSECFYTTLEGISGLALGAKDPQNPDFPFIIGVTDSFTLFVPLDSSLVSDTGQFTVSIYETYSYFFRTSFTPTSDENFVQGTGSLSFVEGEKYLCFVNGEEFLSTAYLFDSGGNGNSFFYFGNLDLLLPNSGLPSDSSSPFCFVFTLEDSYERWTLGLSPEFYDQRVTFSISDYFTPTDFLFSDIFSLVDSSVGWVGQFVNTIVAQPLLLCFCIVIFVGLGVGLISRIKK